MAGYDKVHVLVAGNIMALPHGSFSIARHVSTQVHSSGFCALGSSFPRLIHIVFVIGNFAYLCVLRSVAFMPRSTVI